MAQEMTWPMFCDDVADVCNPCDIPDAYKSSVALPDPISGANNVQPALQPFERQERVSPTAGRTRPPQVPQETRNITAVGGLRRFCGGGVCRGSRGLVGPTRRWRGSADRSTGGPYRLAGSGWRVPTLYSCRSRVFLQSRVLVRKQVKGRSGSL